MVGDPIPYTGCPLDRAGDRRTQPAWLAARLTDPATAFVAVWRDSSHVTDTGEPRPVRLQGEAASLALELAEEVVFLGLETDSEEGEHAVFALDLSGLADTEVLDAVGNQGTFQDLRRIGPQLDRADGALLAYARAVLRWHRGHRFCGRCGAPTAAKDGGHVRICTRADCGVSHHPRTDPAVIMLVHDGREHCVLGRQPRHPAGMHTVLAGFVEPGESLEEAVAREVAEEIGLTVEPPRYMGSQPWPFPAQLMVGFHVQAPYAPLSVHPDELERARWYHRDELLRAPNDETFHLPRRDSIARRLIDAWLAGA
ncbi:NAD+ diphosphatase [Limimonas halophila]|uniref:NAD(+) diphosphatase n=1 Tax=Limimonas halophila TaxID=1082479 RepID=A0A1G7V8W8_9PROT|nr:NAD(+) diphosphatase [Limimonas halophila]SDG56325.1 NAD+ diphosphatase [Limimonas halophila]